MKAKLKAKIIQVGRGGGDTVITIQANGKTETSNINAQDVSLDGTLKLKSLIADKLSLGSIITITLSDEETE